MSRNQTILSVASLVALLLIAPVPAGSQALDDDPSPADLEAAGSLLGGDKDEVAPTGERPDAPPSTSALAVNSPVFVPRTSRGAPAARIGGASRSGSPGLTVLALVPEFDGAAVTVAAQPTFYWHLSESTGHVVNFTLVKPDAVDPILDVMIKSDFEAGLHEIDLAAHGATLETGQAYLWFVAVVPDPDRRSGDIVARGAVKRVASEPEIEVDNVVSLAAAGIWYEALAAANAPQRDALLAQVGIQL
jgi:hypothetical protein